MCTHSPPPWSQAIAAVDYAYPWDRLITHFKFQENPSWAHHFATLMRSTARVGQALEQADFVIPIPLSTERLKHRGFNQSALLARRLCSHKTREDVLLRVINTPAQSMLALKERKKNVQNAFAMEPNCHGLVAGKRIILIDDVMTSGASMGAATASLLGAGVAHITALVFARTGLGTFTA